MPQSPNRREFFTRATLGGAGFLLATKQALAVCAATKIKPGIRSSAGCVTTYDLLNKPLAMETINATSVAMNAALHKTLIQSQIGRMTGLASQLQYHLSLSDTGIAEAANQQIVAPNVHTSLSQAQLNNSVNHWSQTFNLPFAPLNQTVNDALQVSNPISSANDGSWLHDLIDGLSSVGEMDALLGYAFGQTNPLQAYNGVCSPQNVQQLQSNGTVLTDMGSIVGLFGIAAGIPPLIVVGGTLAGMGGFMDLAAHQCQVEE